MAEEEEKENEGKAIFSLPMVVAMVSRRRGQKTLLSVSVGLSACDANIRVQSCVTHRANLLLCCGLLKRGRLFLFWPLTLSNFLFVWTQRRRANTTETSFLSHKHKHTNTPSVSFCSNTTTTITTGYVNIELKKSETCPAKKKLLAKKRRKRAVNQQGQCALKCKVGRK